MEYSKPRLTGNLRISSPKGFLKTLIPVDDVIYTDSRGEYRLFKDPSGALKGKRRTNEQIRLGVKIENLENIVKIYSSDW